MTTTLVLLAALAMPPTAEPSAPTATPAEKAAARLDQLFTDEWEAWMRESPTWASSLGDRRYNDRWPEMSVAAEERRQARRRATLERLLAIDRATLAAPARLNYDLFLRRLREDVDGHRFRWYLLALNQRGGVQTANELTESLRFDRVKDYEDWIARLQGIGAYVDETTVLLGEGIKAGMIHPRVILERVPAQIAKQLVEDPAESPFYKPFRKFPDAIAAGDRERLAAAARAAIRDVVVPAYRRFDRFFREQYLPAARTSVGALALPDGKEMYAFFARRYTTTDLTPEAIHAIGLQEVARIRSEMDKVIAEVGFKGTFEEFLASLRTDPRFYYKKPEELLDAYRAVAKRADPELVKLFGRLPRMPYGVKPIPDETAPDTTTAYYSGPAADGSRGGTYYVNLYQPETRPIYEMEALTLHEAVPGHHLQIALAQELGDLPKFRRYTGYTAFTEGWGLYSESLGYEMGFYQDPYQRFGQLTYDMWRAVRLVVDTGMHAFGWERQKAIDYFLANAAKSEHDIVNEIDRYIAWPGQALAYKIGERRIRELRERATRTLGERFDVKAFHDVVLGSGAVPLDRLEANVDEWMSGVSRGAAAASTPAGGR